jgi:molybdate transport system substrate-binding protein
MEITKQFKSTHDIKIRVQNDCSQNLISLLLYTREADIFIPDTRQAINKLQNVHPNLFADSVFLGYNPIVFMVAKGNPLKFNGDFNSLIERRLGIILANPETSSLGFETQELLENLSLFEPIMRDNVVALSVDSRGLLKNVATGQASLTIDWVSSFYQTGANLLVDTLPIAHLSPPPSIYAASLTGSSHPKLAAAFLEILNSEFGIATFQKYGIKKRPSFVF